MTKDPKSTVGEYTAELSGKLDAVTERARSQGWWGAAFWLGVLRIILDDLIEALTTFRNSAYGLEQRQLEALKRIQAAQCPTSEGGASITPREAQGFVPLIASSAEALHDMSEEVNPVSVST